MGPGLSRRGLWVRGPVTCRGLASCPASEPTAATGWRPGRCAGGRATSCPWSACSGPGWGVVPGRPWAWGHLSVSQQPGCTLWVLPVVPWWRGQGWEGAVSETLGGWVHSGAQGADGASAETGRGSLAAGQTFLDRDAGDSRGQQGHCGKDSALLAGGACGRVGGEELGWSLGRVPQGLPHPPGGLGPSLPPAPCLRAEVVRTSMACALIGTNVYLAHLVSCVAVWLLLWGRLSVLPQRRTLRALGRAGVRPGKIKLFTFTLSWGPWPAWSHQEAGPGPAESGGLVTSAVWPTRTQHPALDGAAGSGQE